LDINNSVCNLELSEIAHGQTLHQYSYKISPTRVIKYFSGEEGGLSEVCFDGSDDDLGMEDEPYDPLYMSDDKGYAQEQRNNHNMK